MPNETKEKVPCPVCRGQATKTCRDTPNHHNEHMQCKCGYTRTTTSARGDRDLIDSLLQTPPRGPKNKD